MCFWWLWNGYADMKPNQIKYRYPDWQTHITWYLRSNGDHEINFIKIMKFVVFQF